MHLCTVKTVIWQICSNRPGKKVPQSAPLSAGRGCNTVPQSQGDPEIVKRGPNFWQKGDPKGTLFDVKGDLKFEFFIIVHKELIC